MMTSYLHAAIAIRVRIQHIQNVDFRNYTKRIEELIKKHSGEDND